MARMTDDELCALTDAEMQDATGYCGNGSRLSAERQKALQYFLAQATGDLAPPEIEGRSSVVDTTVRNTVLGMLGPLLKTFCGTDHVVEFAETLPEDEQKAKQATEYINHILRKKNPGYRIILTWILDALMQKVGFAKVWWDDSDERSKEEYRGQTDVQLAILLDDEEIEVIGQKSYPDEEAAKQQQAALKQLRDQLAPAWQAQNQQAVQQIATQIQQVEAQPLPMLYDLVVKRVKKRGRLRVENIPPEEMLVSKLCKTIDDHTFKGHRVRRTIAQLKAKGYRNVEDISSDDSPDLSPEAITRRLLDDDVGLNDGGATVDPDQRVVWITECYVYTDADGNGMPSWYKIVRAGGQVLERTEVDDHPFVDLQSIPLPHRFFGLSPADLAMEHQRVKTSLKRAVLDNTYLQVNGRMFAVANQVNLDDLLNNRPGGVVRINSPGAVGRLDQGMGDTGGAMQMLEAVELDAEESTGWTRQSQGGNGLQLSNTATQANIITNRADARIEMISRTMAETGFVTLFRKMLRLVTQFQDKPEQVKLTGGWTNIDPREWTNQFDLEINVGLGTGNKDQQVQHLMLMGQRQVQALQLGYATPQNLHALDTKLSEALGFKNGGDQFFTDPTKMPAKPQQQDPAVVKAQADQQSKMAELQFKQQQAAQDREHNAQIEQIKAEMQMQVDRNRQAAEAQQHALKVQYDAHLAELQEQNRHAQEAARLDLDRWKAQLASDTAIYIAQLNNQAKLDTAQLAADRAAATKTEPETNDGDAAAAGV